MLCCRYHLAKAIHRPVSVACCLRGNRERRGVKVGVVGLVGVGGTSPSSSHISGYLSRAGRC